MIIHKCDYCGKEMTLIYKDVIPFMVGIRGSKSELCSSKCAINRLKKWEKVVKKMNERRKLRKKLTKKGGK